MKLTNHLHSPICLHDVVLKHRIALNGVMLISYCDRFTFTLRELKAYEIRLLCPCHSPPFQILNQLTDYYEIGMKVVFLEATHTAHFNFL